MTKAFDDPTTQPAQYALVNQAPLGSKESVVETQLAGLSLQPDTQGFAAMARLFVIPAKNEPTAVILRRGPSQWYHVIQWHTRRDEFVHGAWIKGRMYEERCDVSPDGQFLMYFVHQGSRSQTPFTDSWTAIGRVPWLKALVVWPQGETYGGGGRFVDDTTVALRGVHRPALDDFPARGFSIVRNDWETPLHESTDDVPDADWCGRDHDDRVIFSSGGQLFRRVIRRSTPTDVLVADFTDMTPDPQEAPEWAGRPLETSRRTRR